MIHLEKDEEIIMEARKHWFVLVGDIIVLAVMVMAPLVVYFLWIFFVPVNLPFVAEGSGSHLLLAFYTLWVLGAWVAFFVRWTDYYLDAWYVTKRKILHIDQKGLFHREISSVRFEKIQDVTVEINGIIPTLLRFGDVQVQTAGENRTIILRSAKKPDELKNMIMEEHHKAIGRYQQTGI